MPRDLDLTLSPDELADTAQLRRAAARKVRIASEDIVETRILRRSIDARRGVKFHLTLRVFTAGEESEPVAPPRPPRLERARPSGSPVVVVGAGPAGLFAALRLGERGFPVLVLDRGKAVQGRRRDLAALNKEGVVDPESNYCFGEGGAGTYSDGKLYTRSEKRGPVGDVLRSLVAHGAPAEILVDARPHIGSNRLPRVVSRIRKTLEAGGIPVRFGERVAGLQVEKGRVRGVRLASGEELEASAAVVATGHSARDVYDWLARAGAQLEAKPFAAGVRVEHPQALIDEVQYGKDAHHPLLPAASYRLSTTVEGRGVFSFCMCPGGWIVPSATESDAVVVNGMSLARRDSPFANSGIVVAVEPGDLASLGYDGVLGGLRFQADLERLAFRLGGGAQVAPAIRIADWLAGREPSSLPRSSYRPGIRPAALGKELPALLASRLREALRRFSRTIRGFDAREAIAVAVESRSSSPVRVVRDARTLESPSVRGLYPCGEGAGYAGGIVSAALDGLAVAERLSASF